MPSDRSNRDSTGPGPLALVMGGGGARAAYQVGFLRALARRFPDLDFPILCGVSAGAINAAHLAAHPGSFREAVEDLAALWHALDLEEVFRVDARSLLVHAVRWGLRLASGGHLERPGLRSLVDASPLRGFLTGALGGAEGPIPGIAEKVASGRLRAVAVSTSSYTTGRSVTWVQGAGDPAWHRPRREGRPTALTLDHVMASAALPLFFPAVRVEGEWYGDGGVRLASPLGPAVHLGADRILALSTRFEPTRREAERPVTTGYPPPAQVVGSLLNALFLDNLDQDAWRVERMNRLLERGAPGAGEGLRPIRLLTVRPSVDLGRVANEYEASLPGAFRFLFRGLGSRETESPDLLSFLLFDPDYIRRLIDTGERDAESRMGELESVLSPRGPPDDHDRRPSPEREDTEGV